MKSISLKEFKKAVSSEAVIQFSATWCGPCKTLTSTISENLDSFDLDFYKIDIDEHNELANVLNIRSVPTLIRFFEGEETARITGNQSLNNLIEFSKG